MLRPLLVSLQPPKQAQAPVLIFSTIVAAWLYLQRRRERQTRVLTTPTHRNVRLLEVGEGMSVADPSRPRRVANKFFIVTGGAQGIGEGIALELAAEGAAGITIVDRNAAKGRLVVSSLEAMGCRAIFVHVDLAIAAAATRVLVKHDAAFGRVDGLVNAAATTERGTWEDTTAVQWDGIHALNVRAPMLLMQGVARLFRRDGVGGSVVNIGSCHCHGGMPKLVSYAASKAALLGLTKNFAFAHRKHGIRANYVALGWTTTPAEHETMLREGREPDWLDEADAGAPLGRLFRPRDVARLAVHLLSDDAQLHTGDCIDLSEQLMGCWE